MNKFSFTDEEIDKMLELPRTEDLAEINNLKEENGKLKQQINALKKWIKYNVDVDIEMDGLVEEMNGLFPDDKDENEIKAMTDLEMERYVKRIEMYSDVFNYGRPEEKKMAESL